MNNCLQSHLIFQNMQIFEPGITKPNKTLIAAIVSDLWCH